MFLIFFASQIVGQLMSYQNSSKYKTKFSFRSEYNLFPVIIRIFLFSGGGGGEASALRKGLRIFIVKTWQVCSSPPFPSPKNYKATYNPAISITFMYLKPLAVIFKPFSFLFRENHLCSKMLFTVFFHNIYPKLLMEWKGAGPPVSLPL